MADGDIEPVENLKDNSNSDLSSGTHGGAREGAGRPKGSENEDTKLRRQMEKAMKDRIVQSTDALLNSQMMLAKGEANLYHVYYEGEGKNRKKIVDIVTNQDIITAYLADELDTDGDYYYIATKSPDARSIDSLLDRTYGKARQSVELSGDLTVRPRPIMGGSSVVPEDDSIRQDSQS